MTLAIFISAVLLSCVAGMGVIQSMLGARAVRRFAATPVATPRARPPVTVLKPLHGDEPLLEQALETFFRQDYPSYQIVFGVQSPVDPAIAVVLRLRHRYPTCDAVLVIDGADHGANHKISNVINMMPAARHEVLVLADSDVHAAPDYLNRLVATLEQPAVGVATTLYSGMPAARGLIGALGAGYISHVFLPGALLARGLGRRDCLGATMALRRQTLDSLGGFAALVDHLADDAMLGQLILRRGLKVGLAATVPATTVPEATLEALTQHELRWARTIRSLAPMGHTLSLVQYPIVWAALAVAITGGAWWAIAVLAASWATRAFAAQAVDRLLGLPRSVPAWALPLRDAISVGEIFASYRGTRVRWRGQVVPVGRPLYHLRNQSGVSYRTAEHALGQG